MVLQLLQSLLLTLWAQPTNLQVLGATSTQAAVSYVAPDTTTPCTLALTTGGVAAHDTNATLFSSANADLSRSTTITNGRKRIVTLGKRNSDLASDGKMYSRALFADSLYGLTVTCGSGVSTTFATTTPPPGAIFADPPPFNTDGWSNHGYPTMNFASSSSEYADPTTGTRIRPITTAGGYTANTDNTGVAIATPFTAYTGGTGWTNPGNILSNVIGTTAQASTTDPIVVWPDPSVQISLLFYRWDGTRQVTDFGIRAFAGASAGSAPDNQISFCLTLDGTNCMTGANTITISAASGAPVAYNTNGRVTTNFPTPMWSDWGKIVPMEHRPNWGDPVSFFGGSITVASGVATVATVNAIQSFDPSAVGKKIYIADSSPTCASNLCTIASFQSAGQVTLSETGLSVSTKKFYLLGFGVKIWKVNASGTVNISVGYEAQAAVGFGTAAAAHNCHSLTFTDFNGERARLCILQNSTAPFLYSVTDSRKSYYLGMGMQSGAVTDQPSTITELHYSGFSTWDPTDAKAFYVISPTISTGSKKSLFRVTYGGTGQAITNFCGAGGTCTYTADNMTWTNLGKASDGNNISARAAVACGTQYTDHSSFWGSWDGDSAVARGSGGYSAMYLAPGGQDGGPGWYLIVNPDATINKCIFTMNDPATGMRWNSHHALAGFNYPAGYILLSGNPLGRCPGGSLKLCGPWDLQPSHIWRSGAWSADTSLNWPIPADNTVYDRTCPTDIPAEYLAQIAESNPTGDPTTKCVTMRSKHPCYANAGITESMLWPCPPGGIGGSQYQLLKAGDFIQDKALPDATFFPNSEKFLLLKDPEDLGDGTYRMIFARDSIVESCNATLGDNNASSNTHATGATYMVGTKGNNFDKRTCIGSYVLLDAATGTTSLVGKTMGSGHTDMGRPVGTADTTRVSFVTNNPGSIPDSTVPGLATYPPSYITFAMTGFGNTGVSGINGQSYMKRTATEDLLAPWAIDAGNAAPNAGAQGESIFNDLGTRTIALQGGTTTVYKIGVTGNLRDEKYAPMWYWAGRYALNSISSASTGNQITDATPWAGCRAYKVNECRTGSSVGDLYVSVPGADTSTTLYSSQSYRLSPGAMSGFGILTTVHRRNLAKSEVNCDGCQLVTTALPSSGWHYPFHQAITDPNGVMSISNATGWFNGTFLAIMGYRLPSYTLDSRRRNTYENWPVWVPARSGATHARIRFGRDVNFYCIPSRLEACVTDGSVSPFAWVTSDSASLSPTSCGSGCTINVPVTVGVYYYRREWLSGGSVVQTGPTEVFVVN
jgi:hypothetical protein